MVVMHHEAGGAIFFLLTQHVPRCNNSALRSPKPLEQAADIFTPMTTENFQQVVWSNFSLSDSSLFISPDSVRGTRCIFGQHIVYIDPMIFCVI